MTSTPLKITIKATICMSHECKKQGSQDIEISQGDIIQVLRQTQQKEFNLNCDCLVDCQTLRELDKQPCNNPNSCKNKIFNFKFVLEDITCNFLFYCKEMKSCVECTVKTVLEMQGKNKSLERDYQFVTKQIKDYKEMLASLQEQLNKKIYISEHEEIVTILKSQKEYFETLANKKEGRIKTLQRELKDLNERFKQIDPDQKQREIQKLNTEIKKINGLLKIRENCISQLTDQKSTLHSKLKSQVKKEIQKNDSVRVENKIQKIEKKEFSDKEKAEMQNFVRDLRFQIEKKQKRILELEMKIKLLEKRQEKIKQKYKAQSRYLNELLIQQQRQMYDLFDKVQEDDLESDNCLKIVLTSTRTTPQQQNKTSEQEKSADELWKQLKHYQNQSHTQSNQKFSQVTGNYFSGQLKNSTQTIDSINSSGLESDEVKKQCLDKRSQEEVIFEEILDESNFTDRKSSTFRLNSQQQQIDQQSLDSSQKQRGQYVGSLNDWYIYQQQQQSTNQSSNRNINEQLANRPTISTGNQVATQQTIQSQIKNANNSIPLPIIDVSKTYTHPIKSQSSDTSKTNEKEKNFVKKQQEKPSSSRKQSEYFDSDLQKQS